jgi:Integrase core domain
MAIRDRPIAPRSPWQNGYVERAIGSIRGECLDHMIVWSEAHWFLLSMMGGYGAHEPKQWLAPAVVAFTVSYGVLMLLLGLMYIKA